MLAIPEAEAICEIFLFLSRVFGQSLASPQLFPASTPFHPICRLSGPQPFHPPSTNHEPPPGIPALHRTRHRRRRRRLRAGQYADEFQDRGHLRLPDDLGAGAGGGPDVEHGGALGPAWRGSRTHPAAGIGESSRASRGGHRGHFSVPGGGGIPSEQQCGHPRGDRAIPRKGGIYRAGPRGPHRSPDRDPGVFQLVRYHRDLPVRQSLQARGETAEGHRADRCDLLCSQSVPRQAGPGKRTAWPDPEPARGRLPVLLFVTDRQRERPGFAGPGGDDLFGGGRLFSGL